MDKHFEFDNSQFPISSRSFNRVIKGEAIQSLSFSDVQKEKFSLDGGSKAKGLRDLSLKVKRIIEQDQNTTYKEVAEKLVLKQQCHKKEEANVRRRVYDALNVLIAAGVITKAKKHLRATQDTKKSGKCLNKDKWKKIKEDQEFKKKRILDIENKKRYILELRDKVIQIHGLQERNLKYNLQTAEAFIRKDDEPIPMPFSQQSNDMQSISPAESSSVKQFQMPILAFWANVEDIEISNKANQVIKVHSKRNLQMMSDVDLAPEFEVGNIFREGFEPFIDQL